VATAEAFPGWPAAVSGDGAAPVAALHIVEAAGVVILAILVADVIALRRARRAVAPGLEHKDPADLDPDAAGAARVDLGLGEDLLARLARSASAYRGRDRAVALVQGSPSLACAAIRRAIVRGAIGLAVVGAALGAHVAAGAEGVVLAYEERQCREGYFPKCAQAAQRLAWRDVGRTMALYERSCGAAHAPSCVAIASRYEQEG